jgi:hypothetical protein
MPDNRTIVVLTEAMIQNLVRRDKPVVRAHLSGPDWKEASRGLLAVALDNHDGAFLKSYENLGRPGDAEVLSLLKGVDHVILGVDDRDEIALKVTAVCQGEAPRDSLALAVEALLEQGRKLLDLTQPPPNAEPIEQHVLGLSKAFLAGTKITKAEGRAVFQTRGLGTFAELAALVEATEKDAVARREKDPAVKRTNRTGGAP